MLKKAFTLIELLGVIVLLAVIALIATPIVLNMIREAQSSADMSSAHLIESNGHNYYAASLFDDTKKEKIDNYEDIYDELNIKNKPELGQLYVNSNDKVAMAVIINNKCYKKNYMTEIEIVDVSECDLGYMGPDEVKPTISQTASNTNVNENGWYKEDIYLTINVEDNESGVFGYKRCMGQTECEPDDTIYTNESILINTESASNYVCVIGVDNRGNESDKNCEVYKLDKTLPTIDGVGDITVNINEQVDLTNEVTYNDGLSGIDGELSINPTTVDTSTIGAKQVTYKVQDIAGNVREVVRNIIVDADAPTIVFSLVDSNAINSNGWAKSDFYIRATITDNSGTGIASGSSCTTNSSSECTPSASFTGTTKDFLISVEGSNRACIEVTDNNNKTTKVCSNTYNLDKTSPTAGTATFSGTLGSNSWYTTNVTVNKVNGSDALSGHSSTTSNVSSITSNTTGTTVTITTTDLAGNTSSRNYTIKVDKNTPTLTAKSSSVEIAEGDSNAVSKYFTVSYGISGGSLSCSPTNTSSLSSGSNTVSCTATGNNGKTSKKSITVNVSKSNVTLISTYTAYDADYGRNMQATYFLNSNGTLSRYLDLKDKWGGTVGGAKNGYYKISGISNAISIHTINYFTVNVLKDDGKIYEYNCPLGSTSCTGSVDSKYGSNVSQISPYSMYDEDYGNYQYATYVLNNDGTVYRYLDLSDKYGGVPENGKNGYYKLSGTSNVKSIHTINLFSFYAISSDRKIYEYNCPVSKSSCTKTLKSDFSTTVKQLSPYATYDEDYGNYQYATYVLNNDGTVYRYLYLSDKYGGVPENGKNGYYKLSGISNVQNIYTINLYSFYAINNSGRIYRYNCPVSSSTCTGTLQSDFVID